jgi:hypothetical protein
MNRFAQTQNDILLLQSFRIVIDIKENKNSMGF